MQKQLVANAKEDPKRMGPCFQEARHRTVGELCSGVAAITHAVKVQPLTRAGSSISMMQ